MLLKIWGKLIDNATDTISKALLTIIIISICAFVSWLNGRIEYMVIFLIIVGLIVFFLFGAYFSRYRTNKYIQQREVALKKGNLFVIAAFYGVNDTWKDVTQTVNQLVQNQQHSFMVNNRNLMNGGDPAPYIEKQLVCVYTNNRIFNLKSFSEGEMAKLE